MSQLETSSLAEQIRKCKKCSARKEARCPVPGEGNSKAKIIFIGRNPGQNEDLKNRPFVGRAGKLLNEMLEILSLAREQCAILNTVKCFTTRNRPPTSEEIKSCLPWLKEELRFFKEKQILIPLGNESLKVLIPDAKEGISKYVGKALRSPGSAIVTIPLYHPSYLLRNAQEKIKMFNYTLLRIKNYLKENFVNLFDPNLVYFT